MRFFDTIEYGNLIINKIEKNSNAVCLNQLSDAAK